MAVPPRLPESKPVPVHKAAPSAFRPLLDALVQGTTVELFQSRGVAAAPLGVSIANPHQPTYFSLAGLVSLSSAHANGNLSLSLSDGVYSQFDPPPQAASIGARDLLRELTNQLAGRVKNRLLNFALTLSIGVPSVLSGQALEHQRSQREGDIVYRFRTLRGEVVVTLELSMDPGAIDYSGSTRVAKEGEFIAF